MQDLSSWDWSVGKRQLANVAQWKEKFGYVEEPYVSPDGESVAAIIKTEDGEFDVCQNGEQWEGGYDKAWHLRYLPDGRLMALVSEVGEWTVAIDGEGWENKFDFVWCPKWSPDGQNILVAAKSAEEYLVCANDTPWETLYPYITNLDANPDVTHCAAVVQTETFAQADIYKYQEGCYSVAVDGKAWDKNFVSVWEPALGPDGKNVAATVRTSLYDYTIVVNGTPWKTIYPWAWRPQISPDGEVSAPVKTPEGWALVSDDRLVWKTKFAQLWHHAYSPDGRKIAAIVAPKYGRWTVAVDGKAWSPNVSDFVTDLTFSPDGKRVACTAKDEGKWTLMVDGNAWYYQYDMAFAPIFSADGDHVAARVEANGRYTYLVDGKAMKQNYEGLYDPIFSPDGEKLLIRGVQDGQVFREVVTLADILK